MDNQSLAVLKVCYHKHMLTPEKIANILRNNRSFSTFDFHLVKVQVMLAVSYLADEGYLSYDPDSSSLEHFITRKGREFIDNHRREGRKSLVEHVLFPMLVALITTLITLTASGAL